MSVKQTVFLLFLIAAGLVTPSKSFAINCGPLEPKGGSNVDQSFQGKLSGKIDGLFSRIAGGQGNVEGAYREVHVDVLKEYPNASKNFIWERLIYLQCEIISSSKAADEEKDAQFKKLIDKLTVGPPQEGSSVETPLQTERGAILVGQGFAGKKSPQAAIFRVHASPAIPARFRLLAPGSALGENWSISGLDFRQETGLLSVFIVPDPPGSAVESATLFLSADGYERQTLEVNPTSKVISDVFLTLLYFAERSENRACN